MSEEVLSGSVRQTGRKGPCRRLRSQGLVPGIVYGQGENVAVSVSAKDVLKILEMKGGAHHIIAAKFEGDKKERHVMIKQLDVHPITDKLLHIDLKEIDLSKPVRFPVDLEFSGTPVGVKEKGGRLKVYKNRLMVECLPANIPDSIPVSIAELDLNQHIMVRDVKVSDKVTILDEADEHVVSVLHAAAVVAEGAEAAAAAPAAAAPAAAAPAADAKAAKPAKGGK